MGSDVTVLQESSETTSSDAAKKLMPERSSASESVKTASTVSPTEREIATVAYQLWLDKGCPVGWDQEDWFRAEAMLKNRLVAKCADLSRRPSIPRCDTRIEFEMLAESRWVCLNSVTGRGIGRQIEDRKSIRNPGRRVSSGTAAHQLGNGLAESDGTALGVLLRQFRYIII